MANCLQIFFCVHQRSLRKWVFRLAVDFLLEELLEIRLNVSPKRIVQLIVHSPNDIGISVSRPFDGILQDPPL